MRIVLYEPGPAIGTNLELKVEYGEGGIVLDLEIPRSAVDSLKRSVRDMSRGRHELHEAD